MTMDVFPMCTLGVTPWDSGGRGGAALDTASWKRAVSNTNDTHPCAHTGGGGGGVVCYTMKVHHLWFWRPEVQGQGCWQGWLLWGWGWRVCSSLSHDFGRLAGSPCLFFSGPSVCAWVCVQISPFYEDISQIGLGAWPTPV